MKPHKSHPFRQNLIGYRGKPEFFTADAEELRAEKQRRRSGAAFTVYRVSDGAAKGK